MTAALAFENEQLRVAIKQQQDKADRLRVKLHNLQRKSAKYRDCWMFIHDEETPSTTTVAEIVARFAREATS